MNQATRYITNLAKGLGLKVVKLDRRSRHTLLVVQNKNGDLYAHPFNAAGSSMQVGSADVYASLKRFARGQTHGLKTIHPGDKA
jgi:hypothetical protein